MVGGARRRRCGLGRRARPAGPPSGPYTAVGDDELGRRTRERLTKLRIRVHAAVRAEPTRRALVFVDDARERTITARRQARPARGRPAPWKDLTRSTPCTSSAATRGPSARRGGREHVAAARELATLRAGGVELDAVVGSGSDPQRALPSRGSRAAAPPRRDHGGSPRRLGPAWGPFRAAAPGSAVEDAYGVATPSRPRSHSALRRASTRTRPRSSARSRVRPR